MARASMLQKIETFGIVTLIAVLVWLYADVQNLEKFVREPMRIQLVPSPNESLAVQPTTPQPVRVTFRAVNSQKIKLDHLLSQGPLQVTVESFANRGDTTRPMSVALLLQKSALGKLGISVEETDPPDLQVRIEPLVPVEMRVEADWGDLELTDVVPSEPRHVQVTMPQSLADLAKNQNIIAEMSHLDLQGLEEDVPHTRTVPLTLSQSLQEQADTFQLSHVSIEPAQIEVTFTIRNLQKTITLPVIPIKWDILPTLLRHFQLDVPDDQLILSGVELKGPSDTITKIESGEIKIRAYLSPTEEQLTDGTDTFTPRLDLPPRITHSPLTPITIQVTPIE